MKTVTESTPKIYKHHSNGWTAKTLTTVSGQTFEISTLKGYSGLLTTTAMPVEAREGNGMSITSFDMFAAMNKQITLKKEKATATEKAVKAQHLEAITIFDQMAENGELKIERSEKPEIGTILFLDGYGKTKGSAENHHIVYDIKDTDWGIQYLTVERDTLELKSNSHIKPFSQAFGIGTYYEPDFKFKGTENDLNNLVIEAKQKEEKKYKDEQSAEIMRAQIRAAKIEEGQEIVTIPEDAQAVIIAELIQDESDSYTDYYGESTQQTVYLAFSNHKKDVFSEMRKACLNSDNEEIKALATPPTVNGNGDTKEEYVKALTPYHNNDPKSAARDWHPEDEHREKYSGGKGYYLMAGRYSRSGWRVSKTSYRDLQSMKDEMCIAAAEGRYMIPTAEPKQATEAASNEDLNIELVDYSEKAIAIIGDTRPLKDRLKELGGRFNFRLKCGAGWIFPKSKTEEIRLAFNL